MNFAGVGFQQPQMQELPPLQVQEWEPRQPLQQQQEHQQRQQTEAGVVAPSLTA